MDAKITRQRLRDRLPYDWFKIVAVTLISILVWNIVYTFAGVDLTLGERFTFLVAADGYNKKNVETFTEKLKGDFSYGLQSIEYELIDPEDENDSTELTAMMIEGGPDFVIFTDQPSLDANGNYAPREDGFVYASLFRSYVDLHLVASYADAIRWAKDFLSYFYVDGNIGEGRTFKPNVVEEYFRESQKGDNRFRKEKQIVKGIALEKKRFEKYADATLALEKLYNEHPEIFVWYGRYEQDEAIEALQYKDDPSYRRDPKKTPWEPRPYGIDLKYFPNASELCRGADGKSTTGCVLTILNCDLYYYEEQGVWGSIDNKKSRGEDLFFETLIAVNTFVKTYGNF
ncbi:MAG: hypothetical protein IKC56_01860 [Clostridia bacterium]|nr:hypothetical protein [Clostridia bacterium]